MKRSDLQGLTTERKRSHRNAKGSSHALDAFQDGAAPVRKVDRRSAAGEDTADGVPSKFTPVTGRGMPGRVARRSSAAPVKQGDGKNLSRASTALEGIMRLLDIMATGYYLLSTFDCEEPWRLLRSFHEPSEKHRGF
ncbi:unnamed protein product [Parascedosporium putredinis]|uniref:Uncharacterized protein n=1 Tax=Parascedosporium putredinis TaxID=1442378 RepID=A0A9P1HAZ2_9PEZI|nr:unnamed protein product [Parascedosporium putredinis]CAI8003194.1 unnamed protein product [Parascedosporium putredinis]